MSAAYWREAGWTYVRYSNAAAQALRSVVKGSEARIAALRREEQFARVSAWTSGKGAEPKVIDPSGALASQAIAQATASVSK